MYNITLIKLSGVMLSSLFLSGCVSGCSSDKKPEQVVIQESSIQETKTNKSDLATPIPQEEKENVLVSFTTPRPDSVVTEKKEEPKKVEQAKVEPKKEEPKIIEQKKEEPKKEEPKVVEQKPEPPKVDMNDEYTRSIQNMEGAIVDKETFNHDKEDVLALIKELNTVMEKQDYSSWVRYLDAESVTYWSNKTNLQKAQQRLPIKGIKLNSLQDYFKYLFISSRVGKQIDEIRYETDKIVKAVQISKDQDGNWDGDIVFYNLRKINGIWKLHLPKM